MHPEHFNGKEGCYIWSIPDNVDPKTFSEVVFEERRVTTFLAGEWVVMDDDFTEHRPCSNREQALFVHKLGKHKAN